MEELGDFHLTPIISPFECPAEPDLRDIIRGMVEQAASKIKCACPRCFCPVQAGKGVVRDGKVYCSETCAYECTEQTCVCVHDRCEDKH